ncbi:cysteine hydrolase family protein [Lacisediminimonas sp.]|uniref:cysteine hydrolase family protein n=1 Tax=Lacisediminimonas sp. TaxID=3060582 RepID=UPI0027179706|nr:cysteine hydrolase [Lacisediminimonas sp.]MDO8301077.1 cysteine hydrolase [Lacisediminimonas sp.]
MRQAFPKTFSEKVNPASTALLVIDVQNDFCAPDGVFGSAGNDLSMVQVIMPGLHALVDGARNAGVTVIFVQAIYDAVYLPPAWHERNARIGFETPRCLRGTWGADFYQLKPQPSELVIQKHRYSAFVDTELDAILRGLGIRTLVTTGVATNLCVESTSRDAFMKGYYVAMVDDACATYRKEQHDAALANIALGFGVVTTVKELLTTWA